MVSVAIIGVGPAGCFIAQSRVRVLPEARIDILDKRPVPCGLVRYGVAPDHQGTKAVRQFERPFDRHDVAFFGSGRHGDDSTLTEFCPMYDAVVLAIGLSDDRRLGIPGKDPASAMGSGVLTRDRNDHPDAQALAAGPANRCRLKIADRTGMSTIAYTAGAQP
jgi:ferredoxin--NADP+ reductase